MRLCDSACGLVLLTHASQRHFVQNVRVKEEWTKGVCRFQACEFRRRQEKTNVHCAQGTFSSGIVQMIHHDTGHLALELPTDLRSTFPSLRTFYHLSSSNGCNTFLFCFVSPTITKRVTLIFQPFFSPARRSTLCLSFLRDVRLTSLSHIYLSTFLHLSQLQLILNTGTSYVVRKRISILIGIRNKYILDTLRIAISLLQSCCHHHYHYR